MITVPCSGSSFVVPEQGDRYLWAQGTNGANGVTALLQALAAAASPSQSVYYYGAIGNGTTDDTVALQAAINANKGGVVTIPPGTFLAAGLTLADSTYNGTKIISTGGVIKIKPDGGSSTFGGAWVGLLIGTADNVYLDLIFDGNRTAMSTTEHVYCVGVAGSSNLIIPRLSMKELRGDGIYIGQSNWTSSSINPVNVVIGTLTAFNASGSNDGRNACSVISCTGLTIGTFHSYNVGSSSGGGGPGAAEPGGLDFEPDHGYQSITDVDIGTVNVVTGGTSGFQILGKSTSGVDANRDWNIARITAKNVLVRKTGYANGSNIIRASDVTVNMDTSRSDNYTAKAVQLDYLDRLKLQIKASHVTTGVDFAPVGEIRDFEVNVDVSDYSTIGVHVGKATRGRFTGRIGNSISISASQPFGIVTELAGGFTQAGVIYSVDVPYDGVAVRGFRNETANAVTFDSACRIRDCDFTGYANFSLAFDQAATSPLRVNVAGLSASSVPSTGAWTQGEFVTNSTPTAGTATLTGWQRLTTGTANVAGTDWNPCYTVTTIGNASLLGNMSGSTAAPSALTSLNITRAAENLSTLSPANGATVNPPTSTSSVVGIRCNAGVASITIDIPDDHSYDGEPLELRIFNNSGGALTTTWTTAGTGAFKFQGGTAPTAPANGLRRYIGFRFDSNSGKYLELWRSTGDI